MAVTEAAIIGGSALAAGAATAISTGKVNKRNIKYHKELQHDAQQHSIAMQDRTFNYQKELNDLAYQKELEQWNRENEYNSPSAQMERYREAGLNPNLVYGQNNLSANSPTYNAGSAPAGSTPLVSPPNLQAINFNHIADSIAGGLQAYQNVLNSEQQRSQSQAYSNLMKQQALQVNQSITENDMYFPHRLKSLQQDYINKKSLGLGYQSDLDKKSIELDVARRLFGYNSDNKFVDTNSLHSQQIAYERAQMDFGKSQMQFTKELNDMTTFVQRELSDIFKQIKDNPKLVNSEEVNARIRMLQMFGANVSTEADMTWDRWLKRVGSVTKSAGDIVDIGLDIYSGGRFSNFFRKLKRIYE